MAGSRYIYQWDPSAPNSLARPAELPDTDLTNAFVPELPGFPTPPAAAQPAPTPTPAPDDARPTVTLQVSDDRIDPGEEITITVIARDDKRLDWIEWEGEGVANGGVTPEDPELARERRFDCERRAECANV